MKHAALIAGLLAVLAACDDRIMRTSVAVRLPEHSAVDDILGKSRWKLEWKGPSGENNSAWLDGGGTSISVPAEWPTAVFAWPYWPEKGIAPGLYYPAGGIYPFDVHGTSMSLDWEGGVDAFFYRELDNAAAARQERRAQFFNWQRFRTARQSVSTLKADPWLADWAAIARRSASGSFSVTALKAEAAANITFTVPANGPWLSASPFRGDYSWLLDEELTLPASPRGEFFVCAEGLLFVKPAAKSGSASVVVWNEFASP
ncbi:MAG: hypothetical protein LBJ31_01635 [Treponema sp.]|jgi:hypothetical protein|nr:hypothetical protein [Treponema sp.]